MLGNCEKIMTAISSTTNQWPQNQILDDHQTFMASSSAANKVMDKTNQLQDPPLPLHPLKCPRCDSSNTKFCYYNNYSLSQPRHFCKACKRYWTRGGTLRNVPVGGGCRKNKRTPKRHPSTGADGVSAASTASASPSAQPRLDLSSTPSNRIHNPLFYSLPSTNHPLELNFPFSTFSQTRVSSDNTGFDLHPQMNNLGLGFSSGLVSADAMNNDYKNGYKPIHDVISSSNASSPFSASGNHNSIFFGSSNFTSTSSMASLLASTLQHQKFDSAVKDHVQVPGNGVPGLMPYEDPQMAGGNMGKDQVKQEGNQNRSVWNPNPNLIDQINSSDPSSLLWNSTNLGPWFDPSNMGSSVPSLI